MVPPPLYTPLVTTDPNEIHVIPPNHGDMMTMVIQQGLSK